MNLQSLRDAIDAMYK